MAQHQHETPEQELVHSIMHGLHAQTGLAGAVVIVEQDGEMSHPFVSLWGNMTDLAHMVLAMIDVSLKSGRPTDCIACMANYDALQRARAELIQMVGSC